MRKLLAAVLLLIASCTVAPLPSPTPPPVATVTQAVPPTPEPERHRLRGYRATVYGVASVLDAVCHDAYFYWDVAPFEMVWHEDADGERECLLRGSR